MTRVLVALFVLAAGGGCLGLAMGNVAPGSRQIRRAGGSWQKSATPGYEEWVAGSDQGSKGPMGGLIAGRFGVGSISIGDRPVQRDAGVFDLRLELAYMFTSRVGASLSAGWKIVGAHEGDTDISRTGFPLAATFSVVPVPPFLLRFTGFVEPGATSVDDTGSTGLGKGAGIGAGLLVQFRAWHFVVGVDWEHEWIADVATPTGPASYVSSAYLLDLWVVGW